MRTRLENVRRHADKACSFERPVLAAREIKEALAELSQAVELLAETLNERPEMY
ncbi:MAG: hypothetical protein ABSE73_14965 [Planctomycetota bacterium]